MRGFNALHFLYRLSCVISFNSMAYGFVNNLIGRIKYSTVNNRFCRSLNTMGISNEFGGYKYSEKKSEAYTVASSSNIKMPIIILVNPFLDANVGSVARAMLNFGLSELRVVDPRCDILSESARALAAGAYEILENAKVFPTLEECIGDLQTVIATSIRPRSMTQLIYTPSSAAKAVITETNDASVGIMFGRERDGLTNEEISLADSIIAIPTFNHFSSLNLAQAVNIVSYELWQHRLQLQSDDKTPPEIWLHPKDGERLARRNEVDFFSTRLESKLIERSFQTDPRMRELTFRYIRNIFHRIKLTKAEVDTLHGVVTALTNNNNKQPVDQKDDDNQ